MSDIELINQGSMIGFRPITDKGKAFIDNNLETEAWQWLGPVLYIDQRMAPKIISAAEDEGLTIK